MEPTALGMAFPSALRQKGENSASSSGHRRARLRAVCHGVSTSRPLAAPGTGAQGPAEGALARGFRLAAPDGPVAWHVAVAGGGRAEVCPPKREERDAGGRDQARRQLFHA